LPLLSRIIPSKIGRQISFVVLGDSFTTASVLASGMVLARLLSKQDMGSYRQVQYLIAFFCGIVELGLSSTTYRFWNTYSERQRSVYVRMMLVLTTVLCLLVGILLALLSPMIAHWYRNPSLVGLLVIAMLVPVASVPIMFIRPMLICEGHSLKATGLEVVFAMLPMLGMILPALFGGGFLTCIWLWMICSVARLPVLPIVFRKQLFSPGVPWWDREIQVQVWRFIWPIQASRLPGLLTAFMDKFIMSFFLTPSGFATYSMGARELPFIGNLGPSVSSVLVPNLVLDWEAGNITLMCQRWRKACAHSATLTFPIAIFCIWEARPLMGLLFSGQYEESAIPFRFFAAIALIRVIEFGSLAKVMNETSLILKASIVGVSAFGILGVALTWGFGVPGMACAVLLAHALTAIYYLQTYRLRIGCKLDAFFPLKHLGLTAGLSILASWVVHTVLNRWLPLSAGAPFGALTWKIGLYFTSTILVYFTLITIQRFFARSSSHDHP